MSELKHNTKGVRGFLRRRLVVSAAVVSGVVSIAGAVTAYRVISIERDCARRKSQAIKTIDSRSGDIDAATADLKTVVQRRPGDAEALSALARAMLARPEASRQNVVDAVRYYNALLQLEPTRLDERFEMIRLLDLLGESDALVKLIEPLIESRPQDVMLHRLRTLHLTRVSRMKEAEVAAKLWSDAAPDDFAAQWAYVRALALNGKDQGAPDSQLNQKLAAGANRDLWTLVHATWLATDRQVEAASRQLDLLLAKPAVPANLLRPLVLALDEVGRHADADRVIARTLEAKVDDSLVVLAALRAMDRSNFVKALELLQNGPLPADRTSSAIRLCITAFVAQRLNNQQVYEEASAALNRLPVEHSAPWRAILSATGPILMSKSAARELIPSLRISVEVEDGVPLLQLAAANCLVSMSQLRTADRVLAEATHAGAGWSHCARRLFELRRSQGQIVQAIEVAQFAFEKSGRTLDSAISLAQSVAESKPAGTQADQLFQLLREIQAAAPGEVQTIGLYVDALAQRGDSSATPVLREALTRNETVPLEYLLRWAELSQQRALGLEDACLKKAEGDFGMSPRLAMARAMIRHRARQTDQALSELRALGAAAPKSNRRDYDEAIATLLLYARSPDAAEAWNALAASNPEDVNLQVRLLDLGFAGSAEQTRALIARIRKADPGNLRAELAEISLLLQSDASPTAVESAVTRLNRIVERAPDLIAARLLLVEVLSQFNNSRGALDQWEKALLLAPDEPNLLIVGAQLLIANGERARAVEISQTIERLDPNLTAQQRIVAAQVYLTLGIVKRTIDLLQPMKDLPRDAQLLLAEAYYRSGRPDQSRAVLKVQLQNPDLNTLLFAAAMEDAEGRREEADRLLQQAQALNDLRETERIRIAQYANERGALESVVGIFSTARVSSETMIQIAKMWVDQGNVDAAMKALSDAVVRSGGDEVLRRRITEEPQLRALVALKLNDVAGQLLEAPDDAVTRRMVEFALTTQKQTVREQQVSLDRLAAMDDKNYALCMFVSTRFLAMNQPIRAERYARLAAQAKPFSPQPMALAALAAFRAGNTGRCTEAIKDWRNRLPVDSTQPDALDAGNLARRREYSELLARYEARITSPRGPASLDVIFAVAQAMHARGRDEDATALLKPVIASDSRASLYWLESLANDVEPSSAWKSIEAFQQTIEQRRLPNERVELAIAMDRVAVRGRSQRWSETAESSMKALEAQADALPVETVIRLAEYRASRGDLGRAEQIYRRALGSHAELSQIETRLADVLRRQLKLDEAFSSIDHALASGAPTPFALDTRAAILQDLDRLDEALASAQTAQRVEELNPRWLLRAASIQLAKGDTVSVRAVLETLRWFFREPEVWDRELIERLKAIEAALTRRESTTKPN